MSELVGLNSQVPDMMGKLSQILTIRQQQAQLQQQQQDAAQRHAIASYDWNKHIGPDGTIDVESFASDPEAPHIFGDQYVDYLQKTAQAKQQQLAQKETLFKLRTEQREGFAAMTNALRSDQDVSEDNEKGRQKVNDAFIQFQKVYGTRDTLPVLEAYGPSLQNAPKGRMADALKAIGLQAFSVEQQVQAQQPQYASTGSALKNLNPLAAGNPKDIPLSVAPGTFITDPVNKNPYRVTGAGDTVVPVGTAPNEPNKFLRRVPGQDELEQHIAQVRKADSDYGQNRHVNDEILRLSSDTSTGPGSSVWHTGVLGKITGTFGGNAAADYQKIGAYLDRQAAMSAQQMGLPETNAGLQTAANLSGTTDYTPDALQTKVRLTDAMIEGAHQYRHGLDKIVGTGPNQDLSRLQQYRAQWADNFDPNVFRAENAIKRGDKSDLAQIKDEVGSRGMADLKRKSENLRKLEAGELLP